MQIQKLTDAVSTAAKLKLRERYVLPPNVSPGKWFPRHMMSSMKKMQASLRKVDLIIEVHDARIPLSGRNPNFFRMLYAVRPHILVLNKSDLVDSRRRAVVEEQLRKSDRQLKTVHWMSCVSEKRELAVRNLCEIAKKELQESLRYNRTLLPEYCVMIIGIPNVGKSSIINELRKEVAKRKEAARVGMHPGVTRKVMEKIVISENPRIYVLDTPGIMAPELQNPESIMKLALCHVVSQSMAHPIHVADYLLYWLNRNEQFHYVNFVGLDGPTDNIEELLLAYLVHHHNLTEVPKVVNLNGVASRFVDLFRSGKLGLFFLDDEALCRDRPEL